MMAECGKILPFLPRKMPRFFRIWQISLRIHHVSPDSCILDIAQCSTFFQNIRHKMTNKNPAHMFAAEFGEIRNSVFISSKISRELEIQFVLEKIIPFVCKH